MQEKQEITKSRSKKRGSVFIQLIHMIEESPNMSSQLFKLVLKVYKTNWESIKI